MIIDLTKDAGFEKFASMYVSGELTSVTDTVDLDSLIEKQAYADDNTFADSQNRLFSIASKVETDISARYAEKVAFMLDQPVKDAINEACAIFGVPQMNEAEAPVKTANEMFNLYDDGHDKYAGATEYGTELDVCLAARALYYPDEADNLAEMSKLASEIAPSAMISLIREFDEEVGADTPAMQTRVGSPEYAVFEKKASDILVSIGGKKVPFERVAEIEEKLGDLGVSVDFDANDPATTAAALERLPGSVQKAVARYL